MRIEEINRKAFLALGQEKRLVEHRDILAKLLGIVLDFVNADGENLRLSQVVHFNPYCRLLRQSPAGSSACDGCDRRNAHAASLVRRPRSYRCHAGLTEALVPLFNRDGACIGNMATGQFLLEGEPEMTPEEVTALAGEYGVDPETLWAAYQQIPHLSRRQFDGVIDYLAALGRTIVDTYDHIALQEKLDSPDRLTEIREYIGKNYAKPLTLPRIARRFAMSEGYFCRFFRQGTGMSFTNYLAIIRVRQAAELLRSSSLSVAEIAFRTGFGSLSQFNRTFKAVTASTPRRLR